VHAQQQHKQQQQPPARRTIFLLALPIRRKKQAEPSKNLKKVFERSTNSAYVHWVTIIIHLFDKLTPTTTTTTNHNKNKKTRNCKNGSSPLGTRTAIAIVNSQKPKPPSVDFCRITIKFTTHTHRQTHTHYPHIQTHT